MVIAYIGIGANLGDRAENIRAAIEKMGQLQNTQVMAVSTLLENPAVGGPIDSPAFINAAAELKTALHPGDLLHGMLAIERILGRFRKEKWGPRPIDLDLLLYGDQIIHENDLTVPHPLMHQRRFVLQPLAEIAPDAMHPRQHQTIAAMLRDLKE